MVEDYFLAERPMAEIADELGVTESRVSQLRAEAMVLLRDALNSQLDPELVGAARAPDRRARPAAARPTSPPSPPGTRPARVPARSSVRTSA